MIPWFVIAPTLFIVIGTLVMAGTNYTRTGKESYRTISCNGCGNRVGRKYNGKYCNECGTELTEAQKRWQKYQRSRYLKALNRFMLILIPLFAGWVYCAYLLQGWLQQLYNEEAIALYISIAALGILAPIFLFCMELAWWWVDRNKPYRDSTHFQE
jgi:hypothetical protein